jgi:hypothetical protein
MSQPRDLGLDILAHRCTQETIKYRAHFKSDPRYCLELWRRALYDKLGEAWTWLYDCYEEQIRRWLHSHRLAFAALKLESESYFITETFARVWQANERKPLTVEDLPKILAFAKQTLDWIILALCRRKRPDGTEDEQDIADEDPPTPGTTMEEIIQGKTNAEELWKCVMASTHDAHEQQLAYLMWLCEWRPREIVAAFPGIYASTKRVDQTRANIVERIKRRCPDLVPANVRR